MSFTDSKDIEILYRDDRLVAVNKPSGMLTHPTSEASDRETCMSVVRDTVGQRVFPLHRLDRGTSGLLLFGLDREAAGRVQLAFASRLVSKRYVAVVRGWLRGNGTYERSLRKVKRGGQERESAVTKYRSLGIARLPYPIGKYQEARYSLVLACPVTGRRHQIRRHFSHNDHPVIGDTVHGDGKHNRLFRSLFDCNRVLLHALSIRFPHPERDELVCVKARPRSELVRICDALGLHHALQRAVDSD